VGEKIFSKKIMVRPRLRGAHYYGTSLSHNITLSKIIFFSKFPWTDHSEMDECNQYDAYQHACANFLAKFLAVLPRYRGAHSYLAGISRKIALTKTIFFRKFLWYDPSVANECVQYNSYQRACANFSAILIMVRAQYRGAHSYLAGISRKSALIKIIFFSKFLWYDPSVFDECVQYNGHQQGCGIFFAKHVAARTRYRGAHSFGYFSIVKDQLLMHCKYFRDSVHSLRPQSRNLTHPARRSTITGTFRDIRYQTYYTSGGPELTATALHPALPTTFPLHTQKVNGLYLNRRG